MCMRKLLSVLLITMLLVPSALADEQIADEEYNMPYEITVDYTNQITTVYDAKTGEIVRQMICSTGEEGSELEEGVYYLPENGKDTDRTEWAYIQAYGCFVKYVTRIKGGFLFHSIPFISKKTNKIDEYAWFQLGEPVSHGCIRLIPDDAEWIATNCRVGTRLTIYSADEVDEKLRASLMPGIPPEEYGSFTLDLPEKYKPAVITKAGGATLLSGRKSGGRSVTMLIPKGAEVYILKTDKYYYRVKYQYVEGLVRKKELKIIEVTEPEAQISGSVQ